VCRLGAVTVPFARRQVLGQDGVMPPVFLRQ
jgi:hypothetical protein